VAEEEKIVRLALDHLATLETDCLRARAPPAAGRFSPGLAGLDAIPARVPDRALVDLLPDVVQVIALAQGRNYCQAGLCCRGPEAAELTMIIRWCMGVTRLLVMIQG
jgi:hypothetical protein